MTTKPTVYLYKGLPASGKTTHAKKFQESNPRTKRVNKDDLRAMLDNGKWSRDNERFVLSIRDAIIDHALEQGYNVLVDDTNLVARHEETITSLAGDRASLQVVDFTDVSLETCIERDALRSNSVGEGVIRKMYNDHLKTKTEGNPPLPYDPSLPDAVLVDLDGTLARFTGNPYERDFLQDVPNEPVVAVVRWAVEAGKRVIILSGRSDRFGDPTVTWLWVHAIPHHELHMRGGTDNRKDAIVKEEMYRTYVEGKYNVLFVLDDRNAVVSLWRSLGLTCFQVAEGNF